MKIARIDDGTKIKTIFQHSDGQWYDAAAVLPQTEHYLEQWDDSLQYLQSFEPKGEKVEDLSNASFAIPFQPTSFRDFYAFEEHVKTCRAKRDLAMNPDWYEIPVFYFSNHHAIIGPGTQVYAPAGSQELDFELELGAVIGKSGRNIQAADAWDYIAGFCVLNDFSARDLQRKEMSVGLGPAKGKDFATAIGPYFVSKDELINKKTDRGNLSLVMTAYLNDKQISQGNAETMYHAWPQIIEQASRDVDLRPGDLIGSGTVGTGCILELGTDVTGAYLQPGDKIRLEIEGLGVLENPIVERPQ